MLDAHFHVWQLDRADYGWLTPASGSIYRNVTLDDWRRARASSGVNGGILVQAAPTLAETRFLLALARSAPDVLGVVGWVDMLAADAPQQIAALATQPKLRALRPMLQDLADPDWVLQPGLAPAFDAMLRCELGFDALVKPVHLPRILALARRYPQLRIVIDHAAKPDIAARQWSGWARELEQLAGQAQVFCKLSGLWTEAGANAAIDVLLPYARHVLACFGAHRVLWGSDWPVLELAGSYAAWHAAADAVTEAAVRAQVFGAAARRAYRLQDSA